MSDDGWIDEDVTVETPQSSTSSTSYKTRNFERSSQQNNWRSGGDNRWNNPNGSRNNFQGRKNWNQQQQQQQRSNDNCTIMRIPSKFVGRVIGRGGSKINDLQFESGAKIVITKETDGDETVVKLFGNNEAVTKAKELIDDLTVEREVATQNPPQNYSTVVEPTRVEDKTTINWQDLLKQCDEKEKAEWARLPPTRKEFYVEHPEITALSDVEVYEFRLNNNNIVVERTFKSANNRPIPKPVMTFEHAFHNYPEILDEMHKAGFEKPTPIQCQAWPVLLSGNDLIGIAQTGTGKTLAFLLPALIHIDGQLTKRTERGGPAVLVMAPTRELALQIDKEVKKYEYKGITAVCVYGGGNRRDQIKTVTDGVDIVIATPGRLNDLMESGYLNVKYVTYVVLDEADRMLDMGFEPQIRKVMYSIRPTRQTVMTSATWPIGVRRLAQSYMEDPVQIYIGTLDLAATHTVQQIIEILPEDEAEKYQTFMDFIQNLNDDEKVIVFCGKKSRASDLASDLALAGISCQSIHGDRDQADREQALLDIANGTVQVLIATDVASRGLDIDDITHVINYDFPRNIEEYVHRVGRTGRAGKTGKSISYFTRADWGQAKDLIPILEEAQQYIPEEIYDMAERHTAWKQRKDAERPFGGGRRGGRRW